VAYSDLKAYAKAWENGPFQLYFLRCRFAETPRNRHVHQGL